MAATIARIPSEPRYIDSFFYKYALSVAAAAVAETSECQLRRLARGEVVGLLALAYDRGHNTPNFTCWCELVSFVDRF